LTPGDDVNGDNFIVCLKHKGDMYTTDTISIKHKIVREYTVESNVR